MEVKGILRGHESQISELEQFNVEEADLPLEWVDDGIYSTGQYTINHYSHQIISQPPDVLDEPNWALIPFSRLVELSCSPRKLRIYTPQEDSQEHLLPRPDAPRYS